MFIYLEMLLAHNMKKYLEWSDIEHLVQNIRFKLKDFKPDLIAGIARGGAIPAVMLSHELGIPCEIFTWQTRDGGEKCHRYDIIDGVIQEDNLNVLMIDDINDSGLTFQDILKNWKYMDSDLIVKNVRTASLIERESSSFRVDFNGVVEYTDSWIVFPWERNSK